MVRSPRPSPVSHALAKAIGLKVDGRNLVFGQLLDGDPASVPVLIELLGCPEPRIRRAATWGLGFVGTRHPAALPALRALVRDEDSQVREIALGGVDRANGERTDWFPE
jgi:HEAT repeat protein